MRSGLGLCSHVVAASLRISSSRPIARPRRIRAGLAGTLVELIVFIIAVVSLVLLIGIEASMVGSNFGEITITSSYKRHIIIGAKDVEVAQILSRLIITSLHVSMKVGLAEVSS